MTDQPPEVRTICVLCKHHYVRREGRLYQPRWYDYECHHPECERPKTLDPVTGAPIYAGGGERFPCCRDVNNGDCALFEYSDA